jgi:hypothetical protein
MFSTHDLPVYAPRFLGSRRLARLLDENCIVKEQGRLAEIVDAALLKAEKAYREGDMAGKPKLTCLRVPRKIILCMLISLGFTCAHVMSRTS